MKNSLNFLKILKNGGVGVIPTDTIYGLVACAMSPNAVERIYEIKGRNYLKPFIILISSINDLKKFRVKITKNQKNILKKIWPNKISVILPVNGSKLFYLHRGTNSIAFRYPKNKNLLNIIKKVGPIVAPSANPEGKAPARNIKEARKYFEKKVDFFIGNKNIESLASTIVKLDGEKFKILRDGGVKINKKYLTLV
ncbi:threonylcarbamoyl-AMP synthase [Candidatus Nomurabacteria bacterium]|nr:threonylcarbamoyl-AMP synthase [Candidatus Nomurabacteria bacterium]